jgi:hypothetical protein
MSPPASPEQRAEALVAAECPCPGGAWFVKLGELVEPPVLLGPYENPALAREDANRLRTFLAAVIREARQGDRG